MVSLKRGWVTGLMLGLGIVLVGSSWAREPSGPAAAPALGELELEADDGRASAPIFEFAVRGTSAGTALRRDVVLGGAESSRVRLSLPAGAYAVTLSAAALPHPAQATAPLPRVAEPSTRWLALPAAEVVLVAPGRTTRAMVVVARPTAASL